MSQCLRDRLFLLRRTLRLLGIFRLWLIIILTLNDTALLLHLCDIQAANLQDGMLQDIRFDLIIGCLFLCCR